MATKDLTLSIKGEIPFRDLVKTFSGFQKLLDTLAQEIGAGATIEWTTGNLKGGSAEVTISGVSENMEVVEKAVEATRSIFTNMSRNRPIPYSDYVAKQAKMLTHVINGKISEISVKAGENEARITERIEVEDTGQKTYSHDSVKGTIDTLLRHNSLRFALYDSLFGKLVTCHASRSQEEEMRQAWGKTVIVSGLVGRNIVTGKPVDIRGIREIAIVEDVPPDSYHTVRGILDLGDKKPEDIIRDFRRTDWKLHNDE